jgi:hypothetical protein
VANHSKFSPDSQGRNEVIMKTIIASITRLILSYSKFGLMVFSLSLINTALKSDDNFYYLNSGSQFLKLSGVYIQERQNIRNRKLINKYIKIKDDENLV